MKIELPRKKKPKIILYDIPKNMTNQEINESIYEQNFEETLTREVFDQMFTLNLRQGRERKK